MVVSDCFRVAFLNIVEDPVEFSFLQIQFTSIARTLDDSLVLRLLHNRRLISQVEFPIKDLFGAVLLIHAVEGTEVGGIEEVCLV